VELARAGGSAVIDIEALLELKVGLEASAEVLRALQTPTATRVPAGAHLHTLVGSGHATDFGFLAGYGCIDTPIEGHRRLRRSRTGEGQYGDCYESIFHIGFLSKGRRRIQTRLQMQMQMRVRFAVCGTEFYQSKG
jgi:hypothetical protein